jgi:hypothetical protein
LFLRCIIVTLCEAWRIEPDAASAFFDVSIPTIQPIIGIILIPPPQTHDTTVSPSNTSTVIVDMQPLVGAAMIAVRDHLNLPTFTL